MCHSKSLFFLRKDRRLADVIDNGLHFRAVVKCTNAGPDIKRGFAMLRLEIVSLTPEPASLSANRNL